MSFRDIFSWRYSSSFVIILCRWERMWALFTLRTRILFEHKWLILLWLWRRMARAKLHGRFDSIPFYYIVSSMASNILFKSSILLLCLMLIYFVKMPTNASSSVYVKMEVVVWTLMDHTHAGVRKAGKDNIANLVCLFIFFKIYQWIK